MATRKRPYAQAAAWGIVSVGMYFALYHFEGDINGTFARGGVYAMLPIATAFAFSFVHGNFTSDFWSALGVEASKKIKGGK